MDNFLCLALQNEILCTPLKTVNTCVRCACVHSLLYTVSAWQMPRGSYAWLLTKLGNGEGGARGGGDLSSAFYHNLLPLSFSTVA